jgi:hypothetical protein
MKTKIFALAILLCSVSVSYSQSLHVGIKAGANINKIDGEPFSNQFTYGYHVGVFAEIGLGKKFSIAPEILFNQVNVDTGANFSSVFKFNNLSSIQLKYLTIPVLAEYKLSKIFALEAGPQFGILINQTNSLVQNGKNAFNKGDFSVVGGVQIKIVGLRVYGRYIFGVNNLNDTGQTNDWHGEMIQVGVGYAFL